MPFVDLAAIARRQHGLVTREQALDVLTRYQLDHAIAVRRLEPAQRSVYRIAGSPESWEQVTLAAVLAGGPGSVASFLAAAYAWNLAGYWEQPAVAVTVHSERRARLPGVTVHDSQVLNGLHVDRRRGIPVTSVARTLCDLTACSSPNQVGRALDDALRRRLTSMRRIHTVFDDLATRGRRRSTVMRALLADRATGYDPGGSDPERQMVRTLAALVDAGLPAPVPQHRVRTRTRTYRLDGAYPEYLVGVEYEGFEFHTSRTAFDDRYQRDRDLRIAGWLILYVTARTSEAQLVGDVRLALEQRGWAPHPSK